MDYLPCAGFQYDGYLCEICDGPVDANDAVRVEVDGPAETGGQASARVQHAWCYCAVEVSRLEGLATAARLAWHAGLEIFAKDLIDRVQTRLTWLQTTDPEAAAQMTLPPWASLAGDAVPSARDRS